MYRIILLSALLGISVVNAECSDNGGGELGWGTQAAADGNDDHVQTVLGFSSSGPFNAAGNPILSVVATNAGFNPDFFPFAAFICGENNPDGAPRSTFGPVINQDSIDSPGSGQTPLCLTASALTGSNITLALLPCVNDISTNPVPTQTFEWVTTEFDTFAFNFIGDQSAEAPLDPTKPTDYVPSLVPPNVAVGSFVSIEFVPEGLPPLTGHETGLILELVDC
ncbi:hypothetical protein C8R44DRAFT_237017 [Mycena epipterygia]|nr:hypothetical protein C8R44DRAFT_237017 [Mycena epipterygia]